MEAYAHTKNKEDVPAELVAKGYGSFIIPPLDEGIFYEGKSNFESMSGQLFPQPVKIADGEVIERCDFLLGDYFAIVARKDFVLSEDEKKFLSSINSKILILDSELVDSNMWMSTMVQEDKVYIVRTDKYIFGSTNENITLSNLIEDLKTRIGFNN